MIAIATEHNATESEAEFRRQLEDAGEAEIRADIALRGGITGGGEQRRLFVARWLREKERARIERDRRSYLYVQMTFWTALATLLVSILGIAVAILHV